MVKDTLGMKKRYLDIMERALSAYSLEDIDLYFENVKKTGLTEHGFCRLTANIGRMIARGRCMELYDRFLSMMDFCTAHVSTDSAANDFSVSELLECIDRVAESRRVSPEIVAAWLDDLKKPVIYDKTVSSENDIEYNWALFAALGEFLRMRHSLCPMDTEYIDMQLATQVRNLNEIGMYKDPGCPMVYDLVPRMLFSVLLHYGYDGKYRSRIDEALKNMGRLTLRMQSSNGEIPYGGRSNQFYHNEALIASVCEFEAARYKKEGDLLLAAKFKRGAIDAISSIERGLEREPIHHVKNRFPTETQYGCEFYAYFDKYMITVASFLNWAMMLGDESIAPEKEPYKESDALTLPEEFHKTFLRSGDYFAEIDTCADPHYDASGLGRIHKRGAPSELCLSCPGTALGELHYPEDKRCDFAICVGTVKNREPIFKTQGEYKLISSEHDADKAYASFTADISGKQITFNCLVSDNGVTVEAVGDDMVALMLPIFEFNGEDRSDTVIKKDSVTVALNGTSCTYLTNGEICDTKKSGANRNGLYRILYVKGKKNVSVKISIS